MQKVGPGAGQALSLGPRPCSWSPWPWSTWDTELQRWEAHSGEGSTRPQGGWSQLWDTCSPPCREEREAPQLALGTLQAAENRPLPGPPLLP